MAQRVSKLLLEPDLGRSSFEPVETETRFSARELRVEMKKENRARRATELQSGSNIPNNFLCLVLNKLEK